MGSDRLLTIVKIFIGISIHAPPAWGATGNAGEYDIQQFISIHAPRMGSDDAEVENQGKSHHFNPRPPHGERLSVRSRPITAFTFQSTLPAWGATTYDYSDGYLTKISIHAPRMGSDIDCYELKALTFKFQSTLPAWGATSALHLDITVDDISIHAPRMGSDGYAFLRLQHHE